jgi:hypothetical protein
MKLERRDQMETYIKGNISADLKIHCDVRRIQLYQIADQQWTVVNIVTDLLVPWKAWNASSS